MVLLIYLDVCKNIIVVILEVGKRVPRDTE